MFAALTVMAVMWWGYWLMLRDIWPPRVPTTVATPQQPTTGRTTALGLEDDPDRWLAARGAWTALDECQLTRLLSDSAPTDRPATNSTDNTGPRTGNGDMP